MRVARGGIIILEENLLKYIFILIPSSSTLHAWKVGWERERLRGRDREREREREREGDGKWQIEKSSHVCSASGFLWSLMLNSCCYLFRSFSSLVYPAPFVSSFVVVAQCCRVRYTNVSNLLLTMMNYISVSIITSPSNHFCIYVPIFSSSS